MGTAGVSLERLTRRRRQAVLLAAGAMTALAWLTLALTGGHSTVGHFGAPVALGSTSAFAVAAAMWTVMAVAMMLPAVLPWLLVFGSLGGATGSTAGFAAGYFAVWAGYGVAAAALQLSLRRAMLLVGPGTAAGATAYADLHLVAPAAGVLLVLAGLYQLSSLKAACLRHCRNPLGFLLRRWRDGATGAFRLGVEHGLWCLGCCWALMALGLALGLMSLLWMAALTLVVCAEQVAPGGRQLGRVAGVACLVAGTWLVLAT